MRFSIAHELGHYHIPSHRKHPIGWCGEADMTARAHDGKQYEWEANDFAAELLMPRRPFVRDAATRNPVFRDIAEIADPAMYDVSVTAAALRYVDLAREACALVCARRGIIEWVAKSGVFPYRIPWKGDPVPPGSAAAAVFQGEPLEDGAEPLDPYVWLELEQRRPIELFESTHRIPSQSQVLSMVWVVEEDS